MREGEGGMIWENGIETCIIPYMKRIASPGSMHDTGCLGLVHWDDPEGWYGAEGGKGVQDGERVYTQQWDCWVIWQFYFQFLKESPHCSPKWLY